MPATKSIVNIIIKVLLFILLLWAIYKQLFLKFNVVDTWQTFITKFDFSYFYLLIITLFMMLINWSLEARKWQILIELLESKTFSESIRAILAGVTLGLFTPNRIGEYGGRLLFVNKGNKLSAIALTLVGSLSQIIVTLFAGLISWFTFVKTMNFSMSIPQYISWIFSACVFVSLLLYLNPQVWRKIGNKIPFSNKILSKLSHYQKVKRSHLIKILFLSSIRYLIYLTQFVLLLKLFGIDIALTTMMALVAFIFFLQSIAPSIAIIDLGIRGNIALLVFSQFTVNSIGVLAAALSLWIINLMIPGLFGYFFIAERKFITANDSKLD